MRISVVCPVYNTPPELLRTAADGCDVAEMTTNRDRGTQGRNRAASRFRSAAAHNLVPGSMPSLMSVKWSGS